MPDHDSTALLSRQTKRRRVDIGVKRTVGTASAFFAKARATFFSAMNPQGSEQDVEYSVVQHADGEKSNVLRKLLKRANSYEDAMMPFPGATIISQLLKNNMNKNGGTEPSFQASGLSSTGSEVHQEDICSNSSRDSPPECLSPRKLQRKQTQAKASPAAATEFPAAGFSPKRTEARGAPTAETAAGGHAETAAPAAGKVLPNLRQH
uniref:Testis cDNA, clone: QtsA-14686, similar to human NRAS-related gene (D1S155E) n=1 Tax=Macaca fascicularis TaxID=9541 RepID=Q4R7P6_MACFA|nr:unnamed protein product [Macaca fascicularis]